MSLLKRDSFFFKLKLLILLSFSFLFLGCSYKSSTLKKETHINKIKKTMYIISKYHISHPTYQSQLKNLDKKEKKLNVIFDNLSKKGLSNDQITYKLINKIVNSLDDFSSYISPKDIKYSFFKRDNIEYKKTKNKLYIKILKFEDGISTKIKNIIVKEKFKSLIIDLKDNSGGLVKEAIKIIDFFLKKENILIEKDYTGNTRKYFSTNETLINNIPLYILVNEKTASSSEILAGVLQSFKKAIIVGRKTYGKNSVQKKFYLTKDKNEYLKLTVGRYIIPNKKYKSNQIIPDRKNIYGK